MSEQGTTKDLSRPYFEGLVRDADLAPSVMAGLRSAVHYDPVLGKLRLRDSELEDDTWKRSSDDFRYIRINGLAYSARRIAFLVMTGSWPKSALFHLNGDRSDIRWDNLSESAELGSRLTHDELRKRLAYDSDTGVLTWKPGVTGSGSTDKSLVGIEIETHGKRYLYVGYDGRHFIASTLIWLLEHGRLPAGPIIYVDGNGLNNRLANLREVTPSVLGGSSGMRKNNSSGYKGVSWSKSMRRWHAYIKVRRKRKNLGYYATAELAAQAYDDAAIKAWGEHAATNAKLAKRVSS